jgi:hypothetical protein
MKILYRAAAVVLTIWMAKILAETFYGKAAVKQADEKIDDMSSDSFPSSDPPSSWAGVG